MEGKNICGNTKYKYSKGYIGLPVEISNLPKTIVIDSKTLSLKSTFHVSLVCVKNILLAHKDIPNLEKKILDVFCKFVSKNEISFEKYKDEFRYAKDGERETIVAMCAVSNIEKLFKILNKEFGLETETPPTHVTLYTLQPDMGIGLNNMSDIENKTEVIAEKMPTEVREILKRK
jgi:hypothetical protein